MASLSNWIEAIMLLSKEENVLYHDPFIAVVFAGNDPSLKKKHRTKQKKIHNSAKTYDILIK